MVLEMSAAYTEAEAELAESAMEKSVRRGGEMIVLPFSPGLHFYLGVCATWEGEYEDEEGGVGLVLFQGMTGTPWKILLLKVTKRS